jgi:chromosome segregation ATPase
VDTHILQEELAPLNAQIEQIRQKRETLEGELRVAEAELETFSSDRQRFEALKDVCNALAKLEELKADDLFWAAVPEVKDTSGHMEVVRNQIARFEQEISGILEKHGSLKGRIDQYQEELGILYEEVNAKGRVRHRTGDFFCTRTRGDHALDQRGGERKPLP